MQWRYVPGFASRKLSIKMYRLMTNVHSGKASGKHAKASDIAVTLACAGDMLVVSVVDNGIGRAAAAPSKGGLGLEIMAHRARIIEADFAISDVPGGGTAVRCAAPCPHHASTAADA